MFGLGGHYAKLVKSVREIKILYDITYMWNLKKYNKLVNKTKKKQTQRYRERTSGYQWGEGRGEGTIQDRWGKVLLWDHMKSCV